MSLLSEFQVVGYCKKNFLIYVQIANREVPYSNYIFDQLSVAAVEYVGHSLKAWMHQFTNHCFLIECAACKRLYVGGFSLELVFAFLRVET